MPLEDRNLPLIAERRILKPHAGAGLRAVDPSSLLDPVVNDGALTGLKFASALPLELARMTLAARIYACAGR